MCQRAMGLYKKTVDKPSAQSVRRAKQLDHVMVRDAACLRPRCCLALAFLLVAPAYLPARPSPVLACVAAVLACLLACLRARHAAGVAVGL